jgi:hypothetical protein
MGKVDPQPHFGGPLQAIEIAGQFRAVAAEKLSDCLLVGQDHPIPRGKNADVPVNGSQEPRVFEWPAAGDLRAGCRRRRRRRRCCRRQKSLPHPMDAWE